MVEQKEKKPSQTGNRRWQQIVQLDRALKEKGPENPGRHEKVILKHDNVMPYCFDPCKPPIMESGSVPIGKSQMGL